MKRGLCPGCIAHLRIQSYAFRVVIVATAFCLSEAFAAADDFVSSIQPLLESSCIHCHDADTETPLNLKELTDDLNSDANRKAWEKIHDRVHRGEMPPPAEPAPNAEHKRSALRALNDALTAHGLAQRQLHGRVKTRRLTRLEYEYTLHDLLGIGGALAKHLPPENAASRYDTVSADQGIAPIHIRSYLSAADLALDEAIDLGPPPRHRFHDMNYSRSPYILRWLERPIENGGQTIKVEDNSLILFDFRNYVTRSDHMGYRPPKTGRYRIDAEIFPYQARSPVVFSLNLGSDKLGGARNIASFDLQPGRPRKVSATTYMTPVDFLYLSAMEVDTDSRGRGIFAARGAKNYDGEGVGVRSLTVTGPLDDSWPPQRTRDLLTVKLKRRRFDDLPAWMRTGHSRIYEAELSKPPRQHVEDVVRRLARKLFRRPVSDAEVQAYAQLASSALANGRPFDQAVRIPLRALLSSPQFLFHSSQPGRLSDFSLATRLSYFLWKTAPDETLLKIAAEGRLTDSSVLANQVDRLLSDSRSDRFVKDFLDQWLQLKDIDATTPDVRLYPEFDGTLRQAMLAEPRLFFRDMLDHNRSVRNLIDSDYVMINRRMGRHYDTDGASDESFQRIPKPQNSPRGGLLTQAAILKVTANGTVTSPVKRGSFVLTRLLGTPTSPPPPDIGSIEPDTRGKTTIRETLDAHRNTAECAACHRQIDPPGFAMECFDPIGGFRTRYRSTESGDVANRRLLGRWINEYKLGRPVDMSGQTADGTHFNGIRDFKRLLLRQLDDVARNFTEQLVVYATGGEIQFADRSDVQKIVERSRQQDLGIRTVIHEVVKSPLFLEQ